MPINLLKYGCQCQIITARSSGTPKDILDELSPDAFIEVIAISDVCEFEEQEWKHPKHSCFEKINQKIKSVIDDKKSNDSSRKLSRTKFYY